MPIILFFALSNRCRLDPAQVTQAPRAGSLARKQKQMRRQEKLKDDRRRSWVLRDGCGPTRAIASSNGSGFGSFSVRGKEKAKAHDFLGQSEVLADNP